MMPSCVSNCGLLKSCMGLPCFGGEGQSKGESEGLSEGWTFRPLEVFFSESHTP